jgi:PleD family two-component response regulator
VTTVAASRPITASAGLATYPQHAHDMDSLIRAADDALLLSQQTGRNRTTAAFACEATCV